MKYPGVSQLPQMSAGVGRDRLRRPKNAPTPTEMVEKYESQGMTREDAAIKVIEDLQRAVIRLSGGTGKGSLMEECSRKLTGVIGRLAVLEMKVDSKPDLRQAFTIAIAAGTFVRGIAFAVPHVLHTAGRIFGIVKSATMSRP